VWEPYPTLGWLRALIYAVKSIPHCGGGVKNIKGTISTNPESRLAGTW
jgi:hypothetical protein